MDAESHRSALRRGAGGPAPKPPSNAATTSQQMALEALQRNRGAMAAGLAGVPGATDDRPWDQMSDWEKAGLIVAGLGAGHLATRRRAVSEADRLLNARELPPSMMRNPAERLGGLANERLNPAEAVISNTPFGVETRTSTRYPRAGAEDPVMRKAVLDARLAEWQAGNLPAREIGGALPEAPVPVRGKMTLDPQAKDPGIFSRAAEYAGREGKQYLPALAGASIAGSSDDPNKQMLGMALMGATAPREFGRMEARDLDRIMTTHNLLPTYAEKALREGGMAAPSLGVVKPSVRPFSFGGETPATFVGKAHLTDPAQTPIATGDTWSVMTPDPQHGLDVEKVEMLFAHLKRILRLDRLRLRGPCGARDEFLLAATAQNLRKMARLIPLQTTPAPA